MKKLIKWVIAKTKSKFILKDKNKATAINNSGYPSGFIKRIITRKEHIITRANISKNALKVLYKLHGQGHQALLVGGAVRDLLLHLQPKDFDLVTDARPEEVYRQFRNCRLIGKRFRLAHVFFGPEIIEVATFRKSNSGSKNNRTEEGMILHDNEYGSMEEDVFRRDFTINALYYNIADFSIIDFVGGCKDLEKKYIRLIGDALTRYREDPIRILRGIRFAAKLGFTLHPSAEAPLLEVRVLLYNVPPARLFEEYLKMFLSGHALQAFTLLRKYQIFEILFPQTHARLQATDSIKMLKFIEIALQNSDSRKIEGKSVSPYFLLAVFLWQVMQDKYEALVTEGVTEFVAYFEAMETVVNKQQKFMAVPKRFTQVIKDIWILQLRLHRRAGKRAAILFSHPSFRAAFDFLLLRAESGEQELCLLCEWWTQYINADVEQRWAMANQLKESEHKQKRRRKRYGHRKTS